MTETDLPLGHATGGAFSRDGRTFTLTWHEAPFRAATFSIVVWDAVTGKEIRRFRAPPKQLLGSFALSPDGTRLAAALIPGFNEPDAPPGNWTIWEVGSGRVLSSRPSDDYLLSADWSPDGRWLVQCDTYHSTIHEDRMIWHEAATGERVAVLKITKGGLGGAVQVAFSNDSRYVAALPLGSGLSAAVPVWEVAPILRGESPAPVVTLAGHGAPVSRVEFSPDGRRILTSGGGVVKLWDFASGREVLTLRAEGTKTGDASFSPDGKAVWGGLDAEGRLWGWDGTPVSEGGKP